MNNNLNSIDLNAELDDIFKEVDANNSPKPESRIEHSEPIALVKDKRCSVNYDDVFNDPDYLAHHGILGMHWGDRNGPPYPLGSGKGSSRSAEEKRKTGSKVSKSGIQKRKNKISDSVEKTVKKYTGADKKEESKKTGRGAGGGSGSSGGKSHYKSVDDARKELKSKDGENKILAKWDSLSDEDKKKVYVAAGIVTTAVICGAVVGVKGYKNYNRLATKYLDEVGPDYDPFRQSLINVIEESTDGADTQKMLAMKNEWAEDAYKMYRGKENNLALSDAGKKSNIYNAPLEMDDAMADALEKTNPLKHSNVKVDEDEILTKIGYLNPDTADIIKNNDANVFKKAKAGLSAEVTEHRQDTGIQIFDYKYGASGYETMRRQEGAYIFNNNCPHTTWTYEMRRRGEDVVAMPGTGVVLNKDTSLVASRYFDLQPGAVKDYKIDANACNTFSGLRGKTLTEHLSPQIIQQYNSEIGARGQLLIPGHSMNWEVVGVRDPKTQQIVPSVVYTCAQQNISPEQGVAYMNNYLVEAMQAGGNKTIEISTIRLDNAPVITNHMNEFCTSSYKKNAKGEIIVDTKSIMSNYESLMRDDELKTYANEKIVANRDREKAMTKNDPINKKDPPKQPVMKLLNIKESPTKETTLEQDLMEYLSIKQDRLDTTEDMLNTIEDVDDYFLK
jgi:hypothetical protein